MGLLLFLDTNVFLSFFHLSSDDLETLRQLTELVSRKHVTLLLPDQVVHEFHRNRDGKVAEALKLLEGSKLPEVYPRLCHDYPEYSELRSKLTEYEDLRRTLIATVRAAAPARDFPADKTTSELFAAATVIEITDELQRRADQRYRRGNPPGKQDRRESIGDAINWEALLSAGMSGDLYMVAEDFDWASPLNSSTFNSYLLDEWRGQRRGNVHLYQRLKAFLDEHFPDIKLVSEKDALIEELAITSDFKHTHRVVAQLSNAGSFTASQLNAIVSASVTNNQICQIMDDPDVKDFLVRNLFGREDQIDRELWKRFAEVVDRYAQDGELKVLLAFAKTEVGST
jgi:predicted nucleic acid-binding protein